LSFGVDTLIWTTTNGLCSAVDTIIITSYEQSSLAEAGEDQTVCGDNAQLEAVNPTIGSGIWSSVNPSVIFADATNYQTTVSNLSLGVDTLIWTTTNGVCSSVDTVIITSLVQPQAFAGLDTTICELQQPLTIPISITGSNNWTWTAILGNAVIDNDLSLFPSFSSMPLGQNSFELVAKNGDCAAYDTLNIFVYGNESEFCNTKPIFIPEGFSPNGDGSYDVFKILNLNGLNADVKIFNRWGILVYSNENYQNDWTGIANQGLVVYGEELPAGTYFYIIQIEGEAEPRKDYLTLWR
jgi:gliding motility-associated-like protein